MTGDERHLPLMADCERALGRPERALELAQSPEAASAGRRRPAGADPRRGGGPSRPRSGRRRPHAAAPGPGADRSWYHPLPRTGPLRLRRRSGGGRAGRRGAPLVRAGGGVRRRRRDRRSGPAARAGGRGVSTTSSSTTTSRTARAGRPPSGLLPLVGGHGEWLGARAGSGEAPRCWPPTPGATRGHPRPRVVAPQALGVAHQRPQDRAQHDEGQEGDDDPVGPTPTSFRPLASSTSMSARRMIPRLSRDETRAPR